jgi:hypothetical protein
MTWTCGTRRHRVTEKRYAGANREVKSPDHPASRGRRTWIRMWKSTQHPTRLRGRPRAFRNLWIAPCRGPRGGVMFGPRRVSPRSPRPFPAATPALPPAGQETASDLR